MMQRRLRSAARIARLLQQTNNTPPFSTQQLHYTTASQSVPKRTLAALIPVYDLGGDATDILYDNSTVLRLPVKMQTVLTKFAESRSIHLPTLRQNCAKSGASALLPIDKQHLMIPLKMRYQPIGNDAAYGCVNYLSVFQTLTIPYYHSILEAVPPAHNPDALGETSPLPVAKHYTLLHLTHASLSICTKIERLEAKLYDAEDVYFEQLFSSTY